VADSLAFDFDAPVVDVRQVSPVGPSLPPFQRGSHSSWTGAVAAQETRSANISALRQLWLEPRTINDLAAITGLPVSSVCSLKAALKDELELVDYESVAWGPGRRSTKRARWRLR
jgi:hypothetical protein